MQCTAIFDQPGSLCLVSVDFAFTAHQYRPMRGISDFVTAAHRSVLMRGNLLFLVSLSSKRDSNFVFLNYICLTINGKMTMNCWNTCYYNLTLTLLT